MSAVLHDGGKGYRAIIGNEDRANNNVEESLDFSACISIKTKSWTVGKIQ
jgi:hypothetical protein